MLKPAMVTMTCANLGSKEYLLQSQSSALFLLLIGPIVIGIHAVSDQGKGIEQSGMYAELSEVLVELVQNTSNLRCRDVRLVQL